MSGDATRLAFQVAAIVIAAKGLGRLSERWLRQPSVVGELLAGIVIGPYALGGLSVGPMRFWGVELPAVGPLFPVYGPGTFEGPVLHAFVVLAGAVLLFRGGLETDLRSFLRSAPVGLLVGLGGAVFSFILGAMVAVEFLGAGSVWSSRALLMGTVATATSVGLTVRILSDRRKIDSPEGSVVLSAAVIDDVIGLLFLSMVIASGTGESATGAKSDAIWSTAGTVVLRATILWLGLLGVGFLMRRPLAALLKKLGGRTSAASFALALAVLAGGFAEACGMAMIVGAYLVGLTLGSTDLKHELDQGMSAVYEFLVPMLFCVTGMMVHFSGAARAIVPGLVFAAACVAGKLVGCGLPALATGFNMKGALRIGTGMIPRQEVGLIVAGLAFGRGLLSDMDMNAVVVMVLITTLLTPSALSWIFRGGSGIRGALPSHPREPRLLRIAVPEPALAALITDHLVRKFRKRGFYCYRIPGSRPAYELRRDGDFFTVRATPRAVEIDVSAGQADPACRIVRAEMGVLRRLAVVIFGMQEPLAVSEDGQLCRENGERETNASGRNDATDQNGPR